jgi:hypothetical protein
LFLQRERRIELAEEEAQVRRRNENALLEQKRAELQEARKRMREEAAHDVSMAEARRNEVSQRERGSETQHFLLPPPPSHLCFTNDKTCHVGAGVAATQGGEGTLERERGGESEGGGSGAVSVRACVQRITPTPCAYPPLHSHICTHAHACITQN